MAMDTVFATLACYLLAFSFASARTERVNLTTTPTITAPGLNLTHMPTMASPSNSTVRATVLSNVTESSTPWTSSSTQENQTSANTTAATTENTSPLQTSQSTTTMTPLTNSTVSLNITTPGTHTPTPTASTTPEMQTTVDHTNTPNSTVMTTANSSHTVNTTLGSMNTQGLGLNVSDKSMTILFSVVLGVFAMALVGLLFHRCKHKIQYLHQPLNNTADTDAFVPDDDTLVISGGLYDGHPIYDNVPAAPADQSQFRLEFLQ